MTHASSSGHGQPSSDAADFRERFGFSSPSRRCSSQVTLTTSPRNSRNALPLAMPTFESKWRLPGGGLWVHTRYGASDVTRGPRRTNSGVGGTLPLRAGTAREGSVRWSGYGAFVTRIGLRSSDGGRAPGLCASPTGRTRCGTIQVSSVTGRRRWAAKPPDLAATSVPRPPLAQPGVTRLPVGAWGRCVQRCRSGGASTGLGQAQNSSLGRGLRVAGSGSGAPVGGSSAVAVVGLTKRSWGG